MESVVCAISLGSSLLRAAAARCASCFVDTNVTTFRHARSRDAHSRNALRYVYIPPLQPLRLASYFNIIFTTLLPSLSDKWRTACGILLQVEADAFAL